MKPILILFLISSSIFAVAQKPHYDLQNEAKADTVIQPLDSILILGYGRTPTRIFLDNLTDKLVKNLKSARVHAEYYYIGQTEQEADEDYSHIPLQHFKAILVFQPTDIPLFNVHLQKNNFSVPGTLISPSTITRTYLFQQDFNVQLYLNDGGKKILWTAIINIYCNLKKSAIYSRVARKIADSFKNNKYIKSEK